MKNFLKAKLAAIAVSAGALALFGFHDPGWAMLVPSEMAARDALASANRAEDLVKIQRVLENKLVSQRMKDMGLSEQEVAQRLSKLSDQEVHQLASQLDSVMPGGDALGSVVVLLVIAALVLLIIYLAKRI